LDKGTWNKPFNTRKLKQILEEEIVRRRQGEWGTEGVTLISN
jgi:hypothetical protein